VTRPVRLFVCALQFLTRLPTPVIPFEPDMIARAAPFYPTVGWIVGALCGVVFLAASPLWPGLPAAVLAIGAGLLITGGFHEDGLADTADGLGGGQTPARRLEIMKDSRTGSYGALALWAALTVKAAALATLPPLAGALGLVLVHGAARASAVVVMARLPYARDPEAAKLKPAPVGVRPWEAGAAMVLGFAPLLAAPLTGLPPWSAPLGAILAAAAGGAVAFTARRLIGGYTGDVLGAVEQVAEVGLLLGLSVRWPA
jgi:adenosylcobinamide-GDP ribazoletransferase